MVIIQPDVSRLHVDPLPLPTSRASVQARRDSTANGSHNIIVDARGYRVDKYGTMMQASRDVLLACSTRTTPPRSPGYVDDAPACALRNKYLPFAVES